MRFIKPVLTILSFCVLGVLLGVGAFYVQKHFAPSSTTTTSTVKTASSVSAPTATPTPSTHYTEPISKLGLDLPTDVLLQPLTMKGYTSVDLASFSLLRLKDKITAGLSDTEIYILSNSTPATFAAAKTKLQHSILTNYVSQTSQETTAAGEQITYKQFSTGDGSTMTSYEYTSRSIYVLIYRYSLTGTESISDKELENIAKSIKLNSASATSSPTASSTASASASSTYLLQSN